MWKPDTVVSQHKRRAIVLWILLIVGIIVYSSWLIYEGVEKRKNPSTSFVLSDEVYKYPDVWVCLFDFYGCDSQPLEEECIRSLHATEGGRTRARYHPGGENEQYLKIQETLTEERGWCAVIEASAVEVELGKQRDPDNFRDYILVDMYWYPGGYPGNSTTCGVEDGEWENHSESVYLYLNDTETNEVSTGIQVSYTCVTSESSSHFFNYVGMGVTEEVKLDKTRKASYKALSTSSAIYKDNRTANITEIEAPYAYLAINIAQEPDSWETVTEVNPLEIAEIFGNVGGFWDLLMIFWPIFFVATTRPEPSLKPRNFKKSVTKVAESAMNATRRRPPISATTLSETDEERPSWDDPAPSFRRSKQGHGDVLIRLFDDHGFVAVINGACVKKFLTSTFSAKCLKVGALEPCLQKLLPPYTYVIVVSRGRTTKSIAKAVAARCKAGGDEVDSFEKKPIAVKAKRPRLSILQSQTLSAASYVTGIADIMGESDVDLGEAKQVEFHCPTIPRNDTEPMDGRMLVPSRSQPSLSDMPIRRSPVGPAASPDRDEHFLECDQSPV